MICVRMCRVSVLLCGCVCVCDSCFGVCIGKGFAMAVCGSQMGWICRVGTEGLAELQAISANSIITHN